MEFSRLGSSGLKVSKIVLGCMSYGKKKDANDWTLEDRNEILPLMKHAYDNGIRTFDTANTYSGGHSESHIKAFLEKYDIPRTSITILSKVYFRADDDPRLPPSELNWVNRHGLSRKHILESVDRSIERLGTYIDVLQIHRFDPNTPIEETMEALNDVVRSGKVRYIGASSMKAYQFAMMQALAERNGWAKFVSMQNEYNLLYREEEREMIPYCKEKGIGLIPWFPLAMGYLARDPSVTTNRGTVSFDEKFKDQPAAKEIVKRVKELAEKKGVSMAQIATAWILAKGAFPILGLGSIKRIDEAIAAVAIKLSEDEIKYLEEPYQSVTPHV